jgi:hypothetical protein
MFKDGHMSPELKVLKSSADAHVSDPVRLEAGNSLVFQKNVTFSRFVDTGDKVEYRGFACSIGPDETSDLTGFNV